MRSGKLIVALLLAGSALLAQDEEPTVEHAIPFYEYDPPSTLKVPENPVKRARYPFIDVHNHQFQMADQDLAPVVAAMDELNMGVMVNLSGRGFRRVEGPDGTPRFALQEPDYLGRVIDNGAGAAPGRFVVFTNIDFHGIDEPGWGERTAAGVARDVENGAQGLKIYKSLGMDARDAAGERIAVDDPRIDPVWAKCGELGIPVLIHSADPAQFWLAKDGQNERLYELIERPGRIRPPESNPPWEQIIAEQHNVFRKHPETIFINAHLGWMGNDLDRLGRLLDEMPNVYTEIGAVLAELGRQPRHARQWFIRHQDRILFGKDAWAPDEYHVYFRVLETADEYFDYYRLRHAFWKIYGLDLPDEVLRKVYYRNALRIIPGIDAGLFPQ